MVYMVGSDLESDGGSGTKNIEQVIKGVGEIVPGDLQVLVAYGGAKKPGWQGMTIATFDQLKKDFQNKVIGDENISNFSDSSIDMGSPSGLKTFIQWAEERYHGNITYLVLWDHGSGHDGFGSDENSGKMESLSDIKSVFNETGFKPDVIGFDACLMSELEVASALAPYGTYLVASEELEPGSGWEYDKWLSQVARNPDQDPLITSRTVVDSFVTATGDQGRTLAVIDLRKVPDIVSGLDDLGVSLSQMLGEDTGFRLLGKAYRNTTKFAQEPGDEGGTSVDLPLLVEYLVTHIPGSSDTGEKIKTSLNKAILYERHDKYIPDARGIAIMDPQGTSHETYLENDPNVKITPGWDSFIENFLRRQSGDTEKPLLNSTGDNIYAIVDPSDTASVWVQYFAADPRTGERIELGSIPAEKNQDDTYSIPEWNGKWYYLMDQSDPGRNALLGMSFEDSTDEGIDVFSSKVNLSHDGEQQSVYLYSFAVPEQGRADLEFRPYTIESDGEALISRNLIEPAAGDEIDTYAEIQNQEGQEKKWIKTGTIKTDGTLEMVHDTLPDGTYATGLYADYGNGYGSYSDLKTIEISGGEIKKGEIEDNEVS
jgi:hypothetical protein